MTPNLSPQRWNGWRLDQKALALVFDDDRSLGYGVHLDEMLTAGGCLFWIMQIFQKPWGSHVFHGFVEAVDELLDPQKQLAQRIHRTRSSARRHRCIRESGPMTTDNVLPAQIDWRCGTCTGHILTGVVHLSYGDLRRAISEREQYEMQKRSHPEGPTLVADLSRLMTAPQIVRWTAVCDGCRSERDHHCSDCYAIEVTQMRSVFALLKWTRHLHRKTWFTLTNWIDFAADLADANGPAYETTGVR